MFNSPNYPSDPQAVEEFVRGQRAGMLIATPRDGAPQATMLPFRKIGEVIELHGVQADPTVEAAEGNSLVSFVVADFLAFSPHDWVDPHNAARATLNFRLVVFEGRARVSRDPADVASVLRGLLEAYEPGASYDAIEPDGFYAPRLARLAAIWITVEAVRSKFKLGPYGPPALRRSVAEHLRARGLPTDPRAADVIERYLPPEDPTGD